MQPEPIPIGRRICSHCHQEFPVFGKEEICAGCRVVVPTPIRRKRENPSLTVRETQVTKLVSLALSNKAIATELHLTEGTIKMYLQRIFRKADVASRMELSLWWATHKPVEALPLLRAVPETPAVCEASDSMPEELHNL